MKLDERIKSLSDILTCFDIEKANHFLGKKGYFATYIADFNYLDIIKYGTLTDVRNDDYPFREGNDEYWSLFIPESFLKPKSKEQENEDLKKQVEDLKEKIKLWENRYKALEDHCLSVKRIFLKDKE